ncbi:MAG: hypothetical protein PVF96_03700 [Candidatus Bathyarchaeota archaeon]
MKISIRMIGIATTFFWIFMIAFFILAVYSVKDIGFELGEPTVNLTSENSLIFSLPMMINNRGYQDLSAFNITTVIFSEDEMIITQGHTFVPLIPKGRQVTLNHNTTIDIGEMLQTHQEYLFNDSSLRVQLSIGMGLGRIIPVQASTNLSLPWGAPLHNLTLGAMENTILNLTHARTEFPIAFENHALFDLVGNLQTGIFNSTGSMIGEDQSIIDTPQNSPYQGRIGFTVPINSVTEDGYLELNFTTPLFSFGPMVIHYD